MDRTTALFTRLRSASRRISIRLRFGFFIIAVLTSLAAFASIHQARVVQKAHAVLKQRGMPMFTLAQKVELDLGAMLSRLEGIDSVESQTEIDAALLQTRNDARRLHSDLLRFEALDPSATQLTSLVAQLRSAENAILLTINDYSKQRDLKATLNNNLNKIARLFRLQEQLLIKMSSETALASEAFIRGQQVISSRVPSDLDHLFNVLFVNSITLDAIGQSLKTIENNVIVFSEQRGNENIDRQKQLINTQLHSIIGHLVKLSETADRQKLARYATELRTLLLEEEGFFQQLTTQNQFSQKLAATKLVQTAIFADLTADMTEMVHAALQSVSDTSDLLNDAVKQTVLVIFLGFLTIIATIMLASQFIVENQFTKRIKILTSSVSAIAEGRLDHPIQIKGQDELGDMARALAVFRENARDLRRSNIDLEKFAYVAAHDLRSPLSAISDLSE